MPGGYSDPEAEYYIESKAEYDSDIKKIRDAENAAACAERDAREEKKRVIDNANAQLYKYQKSADEEAERKVKAAQQIVEESIQKKLGIQKNINKVMQISVVWRLRTDI